MGCACPPGVHGGRVGLLSLTLRLVTSSALPLLRQFTEQFWEKQSGPSDGPRNCDKVSEGRGRAAGRGGSRGRFPPAFLPWHSGHLPSPSLSPTLLQFFSRPTGAPADTPTALPFPRGGGVGPSPLPGGAFSRPDCLVCLPRGSPSARRDGHRTTLPAGPRSGRTEQSCSRLGSRGPPALPQLPPQPQPQPACLPEPAASLFVQRRPPAPELFAELSAPPRSGGPN